MIFGFLVRSGVVVGALYYSRELGVWGNSKQTEKLYNDLKAEVRPHVQKLEKQLPFEVPSLPKSGEMRFLAKHYYNQGVKETFHFIHMLPCYTGQMVKKAKDAFEDFANPPPAPTTALPPAKK